MEIKIQRDVLNLSLVQLIITAIIQHIDARTLALVLSLMVIRLQDNVCLIVLIAIMVILIQIYVFRFVIFQPITTLTIKLEIVKLYVL